MLLGLGMHISRADCYKRRATFADFLAFLIELLAERLRQQLDIPFGQRLEVIAVGHHDFDIAPVLFISRNLQRGIEHSGILPKVIVLASLVHIACAFEELFNIHADNRRRRQSDFAKDSKASANAVGYREGFPAVFDSDLLKQSLLFHVRVSDCDAFNLNVRVFLEGVEDNHKVAHGVEGTAAL